VSRYIDEHRGRFGVEPICRTLGVSASAYYERATGARSDRVVEDERLLAVIRELHEANYFAYGYRKTWLALKRAGETVGRDRVKRLMRAHEITGAKRRGKPWRTTITDPAAHRAPDLVNRDFSANGPDELWVADFTYLRCWEGLVFFSFVIDVFSRRVVGWQFATHMRTDLVLDALRMALTRRDHGADVELIHHSDAGSQGGFTRSSQHLIEGSCDGQASWMDDGADRTVADEVPGQAVASARHGAGVLVADRGRLEQRGRRARSRGVLGGRRPVVSGAWRDADVHAGRGVVPVPVLRGARGDRAAARAGNRSTRDRSTA
jgi:putative transposase